MELETFLQTMENSEMGYHPMGTAERIVFGVVMIFMIVCVWKIFEKAGVAGRKSIIPIYNGVCFFKICGMSGWWVLFAPFCLCIPCIVATFKLAKKFGKGVGFGFGLLFLNIIFYPILAFGDAKYQDAPTQNTDN